MGGLEGNLFGVPENYSALDWAKAVKEGLEDYATIRRAHSRFAWKMAGLKGSSEVSSLKSRLQSTVGTDSFVETNPPPLAGATWLGAGNRDLQPVRTSGAQPPPDELRWLGLMVGAGVGLPETILTGNADVGNLATAKSLRSPHRAQDESASEPVGVNHHADSGLRD